MTRESSPWCTRCPKVGRTDENGLREMRDSSHYYCKKCRAEYQKDRYVKPVTRVTKRDVHGDIVDDAVSKLDKLHTLMWCTTGVDDLCTDLQAVIDLLRGALQGDKSVEDVKVDDSWKRARRGPNLQTIDDMMRGLNLASQFKDQGKLALKDYENRRREIKKYFPEYGLD